MDRSSALPNARLPVQVPHNIQGTCTIELIPVRDIISSPVGSMHVELGAIVLEVKF